MSQTRSNLLSDFTRPRVFPRQAQRLVGLGSVWSWVLLAWAGMCHGQSPTAGWPDAIQLDSLAVYADHSLAERRADLQTLSQWPQQLSQSLGSPWPARRPLHVFLFHEPTVYRNYLAAVFPDVPRQRPALYVQTDTHAYVFATSSPTLVTDLRHEVTHFVLQEIAPDVPLWLDEGLAELSERTGDWAATRAEIRTLVQQRPFPRIRQLAQLTSSADMTTADYEGALAWTAFLLQGPVPRHAAFTPLVQGTPIDRLPTAVGELEREFAKFWQ